MEKNELPNIEKLYKNGNDNLNGNKVEVKQDIPVLNGNKVKVDQNIDPDSNRVYIMLCSCFNYL